MSSRKSEPAVLSSVRINRLLRPLRSRCISLAKYSSSQVRHAAIVSTYSCRGESSKHHGQSIPSILNILPQPGSLGFRQYLDSDQAEMARRIYGVRDCFQDIVVNTRRHAAKENSCRIQRLAALCSVVIGDNMEYQVVDDNDVEEGLREEDENDSSNLIDALYDAIPAEYRRSALLSHALRVVLCHCGHNATLLTKLLDIALEHKLDFEASLLLHDLVNLSLSSPSDGSKAPLICHHAHTNFLLDLYTQWSSRGSSDATFFRILITALEASQDVNAWSSKAVHHVAQIMYVQDFASYLRLISVSSTFVAGLCAASAVFESEARTSILSRISLWLKMILEQLPLAVVEYDAFGNVKYRNDVGEMLTCVLSSIRSHKGLQIPDGLEADIQAIALSLSTQWLTVQRIPLQCLVVQLSVTLPRVSAFTPLVSKVFVDSDGYLPTIRSAIQGMASALYTLRLLHLHASLLGCTLGYLEQPYHERELARKNSVPEIQKYRHELIELADEAEDRFIRPHGFFVSESFSERLHAIATPLRQKLFRDISEWEPRFGSQIRKSKYNTSAKKRKFTSTHGRHLIASDCDSRNSVLPPKLEHEHMNFRAAPDKPLFSTLLSRAASKRAVLHRHPIQQLPCIVPVSKKAYQQGSEKMSDEDCQQVALSDDALDLFAWPSRSRL
ncbi:hypothetical protein H2248_005063 [Termitomyces sp. 'cryptogamus']|nr:hypothetical protein H2248_005063 [Termitomyces sp. 'cryptogamus']